MVGTEPSLGELQKRVAAPPPHGFGLDVHYMTLQRFRFYWRSLTFVRHRQEILDTVQDMEDRADFSQSARIREAINQQLHDHAFELARSNPGSDAFNRILTAIEKLSALDYKHQKLLCEHQRTLRQSAVSSTHHRVELSVVPAPGAAPEKIITIPPDSSPPPPLNLNPTPSNNAASGTSLP